ncbi:4,5-DOPA dioxygenase extradiol [Paremcibacter congregatus]|uniref:4,5-DOPA dioxygenase extradiol n=1 Tax=Paremcibacter congregatus TaxID=2043170 RepID=A0A2G4YQJ6_9PROT|nr:4,5-DOPA dioxygenase extradiol [Paremcibacter congregatus]PHZ84601.1 4,5-DOPA dioxygenase extradiol [Paremcibacter congregatus]QDE28822.1 4,5-DOPA dioxygenase extradiol [Paremcibacter congregatus]
MSSPHRMPVVFFGHGSPTNALENNVSTKTWAKIARNIVKTAGRPKAILCISAHWCTRGTAVTAMQKPRTIHDFGRGLPGPLFDLQYPAPGAPELAKRVQDLLSPLPVTLDHNWGLDHGTWAVLLKAFPQADIPVIQLSMDARKPIEWHYQLGQRLRQLRDEGVLIIGSGNVVHNLGRMDWSPAAKPYDWAIRFNDLVRDCITDNTPERLFDLDLLGQDASLSVPDLDHFWPLFYVLGARDGTDKLTLDPDFIQYKSLSMMSFVLQHPKA